MKKNLLPKVFPVGSKLGKINETVASELGLHKNTIIYAGTTDSNAGFLSCTNFEIGSAVSSLGSTLAIKVLSKNQIENSEIGLYSHKIGQYWLAGGASNTGGNVLKKFFNENQIVNLSKGIDPYSSSGLEYYPLLKMGERFPINDPKLKRRLKPRPQSDSFFLHGLFESMLK